MAESAIATEPVRTQRRLKLVILTFMAVIALMLAALADYRTPGGFINAPGVGSPPLPDPAGLWPRLANLTDSPVHILLLGVDRRGNEQCRSDAIAVLRCEADTLTLISVPRDAVVFFPGSANPQKINAAYAFGGSALAKREIGRLLGVDCDGCVVVDFVTFVKVAQMVKTLTLDGKLIGAEELLRDLDGLLTWLRSRASAGGDNDRMKKHQIFITRGFGYMLKMWREHPDVYGALLQGTLALLETDLTPTQVLALTVRYRAVAQEQMERYLMPGVPVWLDFNTGNEVSYEEAMRILHGDSVPAGAVVTEAALDAVERMEHEHFVKTYISPEGYLVMGEGDTDIPEISAADAGETVQPPMILSYFRLEPNLTVPRLVRRHRALGKISNYPYDAQLDIAARRGIATAPPVAR